MAYPGTIIDWADNVKKRVIDSQKITNITSIHNRVLNPSLLSKINIDPKILHSNTHD